MPKLQLGLRRELFLTSELYPAALLEFFDSCNFSLIAPVFCSSFVRSFSDGSCHVSPSDAVKRRRGRYGITSVNVTYVSVGVAFKRYRKKVVSPNSSRDVAVAIKGREAETSRHQGSLPLAPSVLLFLFLFFLFLPAVFTTFPRIRPARRLVAARWQAVYWLRPLTT